MHPTDQVVYNAVLTWSPTAFRKVGLNIEDQTTDWGTVVQRRTSKESLDKGGWSVFPAGAPAAGIRRSALSNPIRSNGAKAWFGWPDDPRIEAADAAWIDAPRLPRSASWRRITNCGVRFCADYSWAVSAAGGMADERDGDDEGFGAGVLADKA